MNECIAQFFTHSVHPTPCHIVLHLTSCRVLCMFSWLRYFGRYKNLVLDLHLIIWEVDLDRILSITYNVLDLNLSVLELDFLRRTFTVSIALALMLLCSSVQQRYLWTAVGLEFIVIRSSSWTHWRSFVDKWTSLCLRSVCSVLLIYHVWGNNNQSINQFICTVTRM